MRTVVLKGGLGNQLFQVACALWLQDMLGCVASVRPVQWKVRTPEHGRRSLVRAPDFGLLWERKSYLDRFYERFPTGVARQVVQDPWSLPDLDEESDRGIVEGYFQTKELLPTIRRHMLPVMNSKRCNQGEEPFVAMHLRLNDYLHRSTAQFHGVTDPLWSFDHAVSVGASLGISKIVAFSDSPQFAAEVLGPERTRLVEFDRSADPWAALLRMSQGSGLVMANSTFSWWAAVLMCERFQHAKIVYPRPWLSRDSGLDHHLPLRQWNASERRFLSVI